MKDRWIQIFLYFILVGCITGAVPRYPHTKRNADSDPTLQGATEQEAPPINQATNQSNNNSEDGDILESAFTDQATAVRLTTNPCLSLCSCDETHRSVDCSSRGLANVPEGLPGDLQYLDLSYNNFSHLEIGSLDVFSELQHLDLSFNQLVTVSAEIFRNNTRLNILYLQKNMIKVFPAECHTLQMNNTSQTHEAANQTCSRNIPSLDFLDLSINRISYMPTGFLDNFERLRTLILDDNQVMILLDVLAQSTHPLEHLSLVRNQLQSISCHSLLNLERLQKFDVSFNKLQAVPDAMCSEQLPLLTTLSMSGNYLRSIAPRAFNNLTSLTVLHLSHLHMLRYLSKDTFSSLPNLQYLDLSHNPKLEFIHGDALKGIDNLEVLDLSHCGLSWIHENVLRNLTGLKFIRIDGNPWECNCDLKWMPEWLETQEHRNITLYQNITCFGPDILADHRLQTNIVPLMECKEHKISNESSTYWFRIGSQAVLDCFKQGNANTEVTWITPDGHVLAYQPAYHDFYMSDPVRLDYHDEHTWHDDTSYHDNDTFTYKERIAVLYNGSLYLDYVTRKDAGNYTCHIGGAASNVTLVLQLRIDSNFYWIKLRTMMWGLISALVFFFITMLASIIHFYAVKCSSKERRRKKSIREVLNSLHDFKTVQIDRLCAYKTAKLNKLSAFKNAKMHKLVAFKSAKISKMRNYKQVTMASIFHHMEKMREHYNSQMNRVRENCSQQGERLRENYAAQMMKIKDYKIEKIDRIRDNYNNQVMRIREMRSFQMGKLRDQYKLQQQHLLKLMELLGIGNCLYVVEAECMRTESMIFDPDIMFDLEAEPVHIHRDGEASDGMSDYLTAGSQTDLSNAECVLNIQAGNQRKHRKKHRSDLNQHRRQTSSSSDSSMDQHTTSQRSQHSIRVKQRSEPALQQALYHSPNQTDEVADTRLCQELLASRQEEQRGAAVGKDVHRGSDSSITVYGSTAPSRQESPNHNDKDSMSNTLTDSTSTVYQSTAPSRQESPTPDIEDSTSNTPTDSISTMYESTAPSGQASPTLDDEDTASNLAMDGMSLVTFV